MRLAIRKFVSYLFSLIIIFFMFIVLGLDVGIAYPAGTTGGRENIVKISTECDKKDKEGSFRIRKLPIENLSVGILNKFKCGSYPAVLPIDAWIDAKDGIYGRSKCMDNKSPGMLESNLNLVKDMWFHLCYYDKDDTCTHCNAFKLDSKNKKGSSKKVFSIKALYSSDGHKIKEKELALGSEVRILNGKVLIKLDQLILNKTR